jgi:uncharacterized membrane protein YedE/YeeE
VIVAAIAVMFVAVRLGDTRATPLFEDHFHHPARKQIDAPLVVGSVLFGIGWGMSGICPGPALSLIAFWPSDLWLFILFLLVGSALGRLIMRRPVKGRAVAA